MENNELDIGAMFATGTWTHRVDRKSVVWAFPHLEAQIRFDGKKIVHVTHRGETEMAFTFKARPLGECQQERALEEKKQQFLDLKKQLSTPEAVKEMTAQIKVRMLRVLAEARVKDTIGTLIVHCDRSIEVREVDAGTGPEIAYRLYLDPGFPRVKFYRKSILGGLDYAIMHALVPLINHSNALLAIIDEAIALGLVSESAYPLHLIEREPADLTEHASKRVAATHDESE